jgi:hypothetical protein
MSDQEAERGTNGQQEPRLDIVAPDTVGTGSVLGIGCLAAVILLVLVALVFRWIGGGW